MNGRFLVPVAALVASACAPKSPAPSSSPPAALATSATVPAWVGSFQQQQQRAAGVGPTSANRAHGTIRLAPKPGDENRTKVQISVTVVAAPGATMAWGIFPGRCGSGSGMALPLVPPSSLPSLEAGRTGAATLNTEVALQLPKTGQYHVNVFWTTRTADLTDVATCANLRTEGAS
jgi:hypothetical protein